MHTFEARKDGGVVVIHLDQITYVMIPGPSIGSQAGGRTGTVNFVGGGSLTLPLAEIEKLQELQRTLAFIKDVTKS